MFEAKVVAGKILRTNAAYRPNPSLLNFPGLNTQPFFDSDKFEFWKVLKDNFQDIKQEYLHMHEKYGQNDYTMVKDEHSLNEGEWIWYNFIEKGKVMDNFQKYCPNTTNWLMQIDELMTDTPFSYTFFSTMKPGTMINSHYGPINMRLRCHLPLVVPDDGSAFLRVAGETKIWKEGEPIVFDDSYEHEACNISKSQERAILLMDVWHPELSIQEITGILTQY